jgi:hypothetical protein
MAPAQRTHSSTAPALPGHANAAGQRLPYRHAVRQTLGTERAPAYDTRHMQHANSRVESILVVQARETTQQRGREKHNWPWKAMQSHRCRQGKHTHKHTLTSTPAAPRPWAGAGGARGSAGRALCGAARSQSLQGTPFGPKLSWLASPQALDERGSKAATGANNTRCGRAAAGPAVQQPAPGSAHACRGATLGLQASHHPAPGPARRTWPRGWRPPAQGPALQGPATAPPGRHATPASARAPLPPWPPPNRGPQ